MSDAPFLTDLVSTGFSVLVAILPISVVFVVFQVWLLKLPKAEVVRIVTGTVMASLGLFLFLLGVSIGFMPFGRSIGVAFGSLSQKWLVVSFGLLLGFVTTWGEPAVRILADQVDEASGGSIRQRLVMIAICSGVAVAVALGLFRISHGIPILWLLVPGYVIVIAAIWLSNREFVSIAVDAGGVATGPLANTFLLALALGASSVMVGQDPLVQGLGLVALIALAPMISVMLLGMLVRWKMRGRKE
jgi:hypothetical protein